MRKGKSFGRSCGAESLSLIPQYSLSTSFATKIRHLALHDMMISTLPSFSLPLALCLFAAAACVVVAIAVLRQRRVPAPAAPEVDSTTSTMAEEETPLSTEELALVAEIETPAADELALEELNEGASDVAEDVVSDEPVSEPTDSSAATTEASGSSEEDDGEEDETEANGVKPTPVDVCDAPVVPSDSTALPTAFTSSLLAAIAKTEPSGDKKTRRRRRSRSRKATLDGSVTKSSPGGKPSQTTRRRRVHAKASRPATSTHAAAVAAM